MAELRPISTKMVLRMDKASGSGARSFSIAGIAPGLDAESAGAAAAAIKALVAGDVESHRLVRTDEIVL